MDEDFKEAPPLRVDPLRQVDADVNGGWAGDPVDHPKDGLASDMWWNGCREETRRATRHWVRVLIEKPEATDLECDRFIASLSPAKAEAAIRRAVNGWGVRGF